MKKKMPNWLDPGGPAWDGSPGALGFRDPGAGANLAVPGVPNPDSNAEKNIAGSLKHSSAPTSMIFTQSDGPTTGEHPWGTTFGPRTNVTDWRAFWATPLYDLRPDLSAASAYSAKAVPVRLVQPSGIELSLFWQVFNTGLFTTAGGAPAAMKAMYVERGHPFIPTNVKAYTAPVDFTAQVFQGNAGEGSSMIRFDLPGPLRYQQIVIAIDIEAAWFIGGATVIQDTKVLAAGGTY